MKLSDKPRISRILAPTDFSENASDALAYAASLASKLGARLTLLHVAQLPAYAYAEHTMPSLDELLPRAQDALDRAVERAQKTHRDVDGILATGHAADRIVELARDRDFDLVVMGTHGRRGLPRALIGSVAEHVVRLSPVPVLTVSPRGRP
jgi:nucleotide-binding universal stress UspA family protein